MIRMDGEKESGKSMLPAQMDDDNDDDYTTETLMILLVQECTECKKLIL